MYLFYFYFDMVLDLACICSTWSVLGFCCVLICELCGGNVGWFWIANVSCSCPDIGMCGGCGYWNRCSRLGFTTGFDDFI